MIQTEVRRPRVLAWFSRKPWIGLLGTLCSIIGVPLALTLYLVSQSARELTFAVNPVKTTIVNAGGTSAIRILYGDQEIKSDVVAEQVAIWNAGKLPIRPEAILEQVTLCLQPTSQILEVVIRRPARNVVGFHVDGAEMRSGKVGLAWKILEQDDGVVLQVLHTGRPGTKLVINGVIEGQRQIRYLDADHYASLSQKELIPGLPPSPMPFDF